PAGHPPSGGNRTGSQFPSRMPQGEHLMTTRSLPRFLMAGVATAILACIGAGGREAKATGIDTKNPGLAPQGAIGGQAAYLTPQDVHTTYSNGLLTAILEKAEHKGFANIQLETVPGTNDQVEHFDSTLTGIGTIVGLGSAPITLQGPVSVLTHGIV